MAEQGYKDQCWLLIRCTQQKVLLSVLHFAPYVLCNKLKWLGPFNEWRSHTLTLGTFLDPNVKQLKPGLSANSDLDPSINCLCTAHRLIGLILWAR